MQRPDGLSGSMNGTSWVEVVPVPGSNQAYVVPVRGITFHNPDTVAHVYTVRTSRGAGPTLVEVWTSASVPAGENASIDLPITLSDVDHKVEAKVDAGATTTESTWDRSVLLGDIPA